MVLNFAIIIILALIVNRIMEKIKLPGLLGMLILGVILGPYCLNFIDKKIIDISSELRGLALIVILLRAGLGINKETLNIVGKTAIKLSIIPGILEGIVVIILATKLLGFDLIQAGLLGFIIAAVSPAVIVPQMLSLKEKRLGQNKQVPTLILAGASIDDVIAITIFSSFLAIFKGENINIIKQVALIPVNIVLGIIAGIIIGISLYYLFNSINIRDTKKVFILLSVSVIFNYLEKITQISTLLGVMTIGFVLLEKSPTIAKNMSAKLNKVWIIAEIVLFVLIGAQVNILVAWELGLLGIIIVIIGLLGRSIGVWISTKGSILNIKERIFCVISYWPKATVQAAIGAIPLSVNAPFGKEILALSVLAIIITAPIGAIAINFSAPKLLEKSID